VIGNGRSVVHQLWKCNANDEIAGEIMLTALKSHVGFSSFLMTGVLFFGISGFRAGFLVDFVQNWINRKTEKVYYVI